MAGNFQACQTIIPAATKAQSSLKKTAGVSSASKPSAAASLSTAKSAASAMFGHRLQSGDTTDNHAITHGTKKKAAMIRPLEGSTAAPKGSVSTRPMRIYDT